MGCIMKLYRDWQLSGDDDLLRRLWPNAKKALAFCWVQGGWDADKDGVMEGCQHNTMDVEYFGPNPQMEAWYLGALRSAEEMARYLGDEGFEAECRALFEQGRAWSDAHLFNGEYYEHEVRPVKDVSEIYDGLLVGMGARDLSNPDYQLGPGCLVDQLVGQFMAHICGLGYLLDSEHVRTTLRSIRKYNRRENFNDHFNCMRSYVLGDEAALLMATYPKGRPERPFPYFTEVMTGFEYAAAVGMLYEGQVDEGLESIRDIRARYDGAKRSPFDEAECGHHYGRAMASWAAVLALTGFHYSAHDARMTFAARAGRHFWSTGSAWGTCELRREAAGWSARVEVLGGHVALRQLVLTGVGEAQVQAAEVMGRGQGTSAMIG
jgi:non-lysosomal glucosylceramidase